MICCGLLRDTVTIITPGVITDRYGQPSDDWDDPASEIEVQAFFQSSALAAGEKETANRDAVVRDATILLDIGTDITRVDRIVYGGMTYEIVSTPRELNTPTGAYGLSANLRVVSG
jgi:head-tail adaptor